MKYRADIDGLRAIAVVPVILYHAGFELFSGGFVGVDVFFVISGYLITSIILNEIEKEAFSLKEFYKRRARRILPALFVVLFSCLPFAWFWLMPQDLKSFCKSLIGVIFFGSNIVFYKQSNYFAGDAELKPLLHTWSLAVEEQYYLIFPLFLLFFWKSKRNSITWLVSIVFLISLIWAQWASNNNPSFAFYMLPTRCWELLIGVFAAYTQNSKKSIECSDKYQQLLSFTGLLSIVASVFIYDSKTPFPSIYTLVPTLGAGLIILFSSQKTLTYCILQSPIPRSIGLISYSVYLWHQPLFAFAKHRSLDAPSTYQMYFLIFLTFILAFISWKYIELPFRKKEHIKNTKATNIYIAASTLLILTSLIGLTFKGFPKRLPEIANQEIDIARSDNGYCFYSIDNNPNLKLGNEGLECWLGDNKSEIKGVMFGDSFAGHYEPFWSELAHNAKLNINVITTNWCHPSFNEEFLGPRSSRAFSQCIMNRKFIHENINKYDFAIISGAWADLLDKDKINGSTDFIDIISNKIKLIIVMPSPKLYDINISDAYKKSKWFNEDFDITKIKCSRDNKSNDANTYLKKYVEKYNNVIFIDRNSLYISNNLFTEASPDHIPYSFDGSHLNIFGAKALAKNFMSSEAYSTLLSRLR